MPEIPAQCPQCGCIFASGIEATNSRGLVLSDNKSRCPRCGTMSPVAEGVFDATTETIRVIAGSRFTREMIDAFQGVVRDAAAGTVSQDEAIRRAEKIDPKLGRLLKQAFGFGLPGAALLLTIVQLSVGHMDADGAHKDALVQEALMEQILGEVARQPIAPQVSPTPPSPRLPGLGGSPYRPTKP